MKFEYMKMEGEQGRAVFMPIIPVLFKKPEGGTLGAYALVDSGAGRSFFDAEYAIQLGIQDIEAGQKEEFLGITGHVLTGYRHEVTLLVGGNPFVISIAFCPNFSPDVFHGILGQEDFFSLFRIKFSYVKSQIELVPEHSAGK